MTGLVTTSFHTSYTALIPPWAVGCRLAENPAPRNHLRKDKAPALVGWAGCCHTKRKNQYCWWKDSTSCSALPRYWLLLSFSFPVAEQASKGSCDSHWLWSRVKHLGGGNLGHQSRCFITIVRQRRISRALQTCLLFSSSLNKPFNSSTCLQPSLCTHGYHHRLLTAIYTRLLTTAFQTTQGSPLLTWDRNLHTWKPKLWQRNQWKLY